MLKAVEQLNQSDLEKFVSQVIILHTQRKSDQLLKAKTELFPENHHYIFSDNHIYYNQLRAIAEENLTNEEYRELLRLSEQIDQLQAHRL